MCYPKTGIDNGLHQCGGSNAVGVIHHIGLTRIERDAYALHARQGGQHVLHAVDAATAGHAGDSKLESGHVVPRKIAEAGILLFARAFAQGFFGMVDQAICHDFRIDGKRAIGKCRFNRFDLAGIGHVD